MGLAFTKQFPEYNSAKGWETLQWAYKDYSAQNGTSVLMFDLENNMELVGASVTKDPT